MFFVKITNPIKLCFPKSYVYTIAFSARRRKISSVGEERFLTPRAISTIASTIYHNHLQQVYLSERGV